MTDISFGLFIAACGAQSLGFRFLHGRWADALLAVFAATLIWGVAIVGFKVRLFAPVGEWVDTLLVFAGAAMILANAILDKRLRASVGATSRQ